MWLPEEPPIVAIIDESIRVGRHVDFDASMRLSDTLRRAGTCNVIQIFLGNPKGGKARILDPRDVLVSNSWMKKYPSRVYSHLPYTTSAATEDPSSSLKRMREEAMQLKKIDGRAVLHPGSASSCGATMATVAERLESLGDLKNYIVAENSAGEGKKLMSSLAEMADLARRMPDIQFCLDTCHMYGRGLCRFGSKVETLRFFADWERLIGIKRIRCFHLNDSLEPFGSRKDRHALIEPLVPENERCEDFGRGLIWDKSTDGLVPILNIAASNHIDLICEHAGATDGYLVRVRKLYEASVTQA